MSLRQKILKVVYPVFVGINKLRNKGTTVLANDHNLIPSSSIYDLSVVLNNGNTLSLADLKGRNVLFVNTASNCGFTAQFEDLQKLYEKNNENLEIIGFPANDFKQQEKGTDEEIAEFCKVNYGVTFPLVKKCSVLKGSGQHDVFKWLTDKTRNGWNDKSPSWNFSKYLINKNGILTNYFGPSVSPLSKEVQAAINQ